MGIAPPLGVLDTKKRYVLPSNRGAAVLIVKGNKDEKDK